MKRDERAAPDYTLPNTGCEELVSKDSGKRENVSRMPFIHNMLPGVAFHSEMIAESNSHSPVPS
jgi:hypothetical protein